MRGFSNRFCITKYLTLLLLALVMVGCTMTADTTLGSDIMPEEQVMAMRHLKIRGNHIIRIDTSSGTNGDVDMGAQGKNFFETRLYRTDSLLASNTGVGYIGVRRSDTLGVRTAGFASTMLYMNAIDKENGFGYKPIFDTMHLVLTIDNYGGDTLVPTRYKVYELTKPLVGNVLKHDKRRGEDSVSYINCDLSGVYDSEKPIFEFTFPNSELGEGPSTLMLALETVKGADGKISAQTWDFVRRLMLIPDNYASADWDGWGNSGVEIYTDDEKWVSNFHGLYITPDTEYPDTERDSQGAMYALDLSASGLMLQGRNRNPKDPSMIKDTVGMYYYFYDSDSKYNASTNKVTRNYAESLTGGASLLNSVVMECTEPMEGRTEVSTCYVEGMGGPTTEIFITDDLLDAMLDLETSESATYSKMGINQCVLTMYVDGAYYDWEQTQGNASDAKFIEMLNRSFSRLGSYLDYNTFSPVDDYDYIYENNYDSETIYGGYLDRSRGCYTMNITAYIQRLFNYAKRVRQEDGTYAFNESDADYVKRTIYIGAEATSPYSFATSVLQGAGEENVAPIQVDLTYTLIK